MNIMKIAVIGGDSSSRAAGALFASCQHLVHHFDLLSREVDPDGWGVGPHAKGQFGSTSSPLTEESQPRWAGVVAKSDVVWITIVRQNLDTDADVLERLKRIAAQVAPFVRAGALTVLCGNAPLGANGFVASVMQGAAERPFDVANVAWLDDGGARAEPVGAPWELVLGVRNGWVEQLLRALCHPWERLSNGNRIHVLPPEKAELMLARRTSGYRSDSWLFRIDRSAHPSGVQDMSGDEGPIRSSVSAEPVSRLLVEHFPQGLQRKRIGIWGWQGGESAEGDRAGTAVKMVDRLLDLGAHVVLHDPGAVSHDRRLQAPPLQSSEDPWDVARHAHALGVLSGHAIPAAWDLARLRATMDRPLLIDATGDISRDACLAAGLTLLAAPNPYDPLRRHTSLLSAVGTASEVLPCEQANLTLTETPRDGLG